MSLRKTLIRLAHANPELRPHLLPLIKASGRTASGTRYQVAKNSGTKMYDSLEELLRHYEQTGTHSRPGTRRELQGQPKLRGLLGPMWGGDRGGVITIRYESKAHYLSYD